MHININLYCITIRQVNILRENNHIFVLLHRTISYSVLSRDNAELFKTFVCLLWWVKIRLSTNLWSNLGLTLKAQTYFLVSNFTILYCDTLKMNTYKIISLSRYEPTTNKCYWTNLSLKNRFSKFRFNKRGRVCIGVVILTVNWSGKSPRSALLEKQVLTGEKTAKCRRGRPRTGWLEAV